MNGERRIEDGERNRMNRKTEILAVNSSCYSQFMSDVIGIICHNTKNWHNVR